MSDELRAKVIKLETDYATLQRVVEAQIQTIDRLEDENVRLREKLLDAQDELTRERKRFWPRFGR